MKLSSRRPKKAQSHDQGQSLTEFALVLPLLLVILMGVFDLGRAVYYYNVISASARETARKSIVCGGVSTNVNCTAADAATKTFVVGTMAGVPVTETDITISPSSRRFGQTLTVTINVSFVPATPIIATILDASGELHLHAQAQMTVE